MTCSGGLNAPPTGSITYSFNSAVLGTLPLTPSGSASTASLSISTLPTGSDHVTFAYSGDANYTAQSITFVQNVNQASAAVTLGALNVTYDSTAHLGDGRHQSARIDRRRHVQRLQHHADERWELRRHRHGFRYQLPGQRQRHAGDRSRAGDGNARQPERHLRRQHARRNGHDHAAGLGTALTYNGSSTVPTAAGNYAVVATVTDANHTGSVSGTLVIDQASAVIDLTDLQVVYDGTPHGISAMTTPAGLPVTVTFNGAATPPTAAGSYSVLGLAGRSELSGPRLRRAHNFPGQSNHRAHGPERGLRRHCTRGNCIDHAARPDRCGDL